MNCHNATAHPNGPGTPGNDFLWSLAINAYAPPPPKQANAKLKAKPQARLAPSSAAAIKSLVALQHQAIAENKAALKKLQAAPKPKTKTPEKPKDK
jgi:hypothetical protein